MLGGAQLCSMPGTYYWTAHQTSTRQAGVQKKETLVAGSELFVHTPGTVMNRAPSVFRAPLKTLNTACMHGPGPWAFTISLPVLHGDSNHSTTVLGHRTTCASHAARWLLRRVALLWMQLPRSCLSRRLITRRHCGF